MFRIVRSELSELATGQRELRRFGFVMAVVLGAIAAFILWKADWVMTTASTTLGIVAILFGLASVVAPSSLRPVYYAWMTIAIVLGFVMTRVILSVVFYLLLTPIGLLLRILGKDPLTKGPDASQDTYWIVKEYRTRDASRFEKYY